MWGGLLGLKEEILKLTRKSCSSEASRFFTNTHMQVSKQYSKVNTETTASKQGVFLTFNPEKSENEPMTTHKKSKESIHSLVLFGKRSRQFLGRDQLPCALVILSKKSEFLGQLAAPMFPGFYYSAFLEQLQSMSEERIFFSLSKGFRAHGKILKKLIK